MSGSKNGRRPWSKFWDADWIADEKVRALSWPAHGVLQYLWAFSRTQTDEPGKLVVNGRRITAGTEPGRSRDGACTLPALIRAGASPQPGVNRRNIQAWCQEVIQAGFFVEDDHGILYSPRIVREHEEYEKLSTYGKKGAERRYSGGGHYNRVDPIATPIAEAIATPIGRSEADTDTEAEQPRARARDYSSKAEDKAVRFLEELSSVQLTPTDQEIIRTASSGKTPTQLNTALERIRIAYQDGTVKSLVRFAAKVIAEQPPVQETKNVLEATLIQRARKLCSDLNLPWNDFNVQALRTVEAHASIADAVNATWDDARARLFTSDSPAVWWDRFTQHLEQPASAE